jgi:hypothetical protein
MTIEVKKFGTILNGRPSGREAALVLKQLLAKVDKREEIILDFSDVLVFTPSYADEFLRDIKSAPYTTHLINASPLVKDTLTAIDFPQK